MILIPSLFPSMYYEPSRQHGICRGGHAIHPFINFMQDKSDLSLISYLNGLRFTEFQKKYSGGGEMKNAIKKGVVTIAALATIVGAGYGVKSAIAHDDVTQHLRGANGNYYGHCMDENEMGGYHHGWGGHMMDEYMGRGHMGPMYDGNMMDEDRMGPGFGGHMMDDDEMPHNYRNGDDKK